MNIPGEIYSKILRTAELPYYTRLNKSILNESRLDMYEAVCQRAITKQEEKNYASDGNIIGLMTNYHHSEISAQFAVYTILLSDYKLTNDRVVDILRFRLSYIQTYEGTLLLDYQYNEINLNNKDIIYYDLLTTYRILSKRLNCHNVNNYAKNQTLNILNHAITQWSTPMQYMKLFAYLYINVKVMNLPYHGPNLIFMIEEDKDIFEEVFMGQFALYIDYIPTMIEQIKRYLNFIFTF